MACSLIMISAGTAEEARSLANGMVAKRLVASANVMAPMLSFFRWQGELTEREEVLVLAKTPERRVAEVVDFVKEQHGYDCPCIISLPIDSGYRPYLQWVEDSCTPKDAGASN